MHIRFGLARTFSAVAALAFASLSSFAATPASGSIAPSTTATATWTGAPVGTTNGESTCVDGTNCDVYTLTVTGTTTQWAGKYVTIAISWGLPVTDYDLYVHQASVTGPVVGSSTGGAPGTSETVTIAPATTGVGTYVIHVPAFTSTGSDPYTGKVTVGTTPPAPARASISATFANYESPAGIGDNSGEPSIGANWNSGNLMTDAVLQTLKVNFNTATSPAKATWTDVSTTLTSTTSLDPILFTDHTTGRTFVSQLAGTTSLMAFSDNDGGSWTPSQGGGIASGVDHQTVGGGPFFTCTSQQLTQNPTQCAAVAARGPLTSYPNAVYYASQDIGTALLALSQDGGLTFGNAQPMYALTQCGGLHGHIKVGPDGTVFVPNKSCGSTQGLVVSQDNGLTFAVRNVTGSTTGSSDPSVGVGNKGRVYFGYVGSNGHAMIATTDDNGLSWQNNIDVGAQRSIQNTFAPEVVAGDNDRAAYFFLGTPSAGPGTADDTGTVFNGVWHAYVALTLDGGKSWATFDTTEKDPVQLGVVCTNGTTCPSGTRNLLDFNDVTIDKQGRVYFVYTDGCISSACITTGNNATAPHTKAQNDGATKAAIIRQQSGKSLFSKYDSTPLKP